MRLVLVALLTAGSAMTGHAADLPAGTPPTPPELPLFTWTGAYSGLFAGGGTLDDRTRPACIGADGRAGGLNCPVRAPLSRETRDFIAGSEIGYDHQITPGAGLVVGAAADYQFTPIRSYEIETGDFARAGQRGLAFPNGVYHAGQRLDWLATVRGKVGYAFGRTFVYGTGGLAFGDVRIDTNTTAAATPNASRTNIPDFDGRKGDLRFGYVAGGGIEYALSPHLSVKGEVLYYDLGARTVTGQDSTGRFPRLSVGSRVATSGVLGRIGIDYRFADGGLPLIGPVTDVARALANPVPYVAPTAQIWDFEIGARYFYSTGKFAKSFYRPADQTIISRLSYRGLDAHAGETFARLDHTSSGLFVKGFLGSGFITSGGRLNDEDFPPIRGNAYSNTLSRIYDGDIDYAAIDAGYTVLRGEGFRLGTFVGYQHDGARPNATNGRQIASNPVIGVGTIPNAFASLSQDNHWNALRVGLVGEARYDRIKLTLEGAYLPLVGLNGFDRHWQRGNINPLTEQGTGDGYFLQGVIAYDLTPAISLGVGARTWRMSVGRQDGTTQFPNVTEPARFTTQRYGAFAQMSYRFTDPDFGLGALITK